MKPDFHLAFRADFATGRLYWRNPPKNHAEKAGREAGYLCKGKGKNKDYWQVRLGGRTFKRAQVIYFLANGRWPFPMVDHANGDSLDDRPCNLRRCNAQQNRVNSARKTRRHDLPQGVYLTKQGRFMARITVGGRGRSLGTFDTPADAEAVYQTHRREVFGEFA